MPDSHSTGHRLSDSMLQGGLITLGATGVLAVLYVFFNAIDPAVNNDRVTNEHWWKVLGKPFDVAIPNNSLSDDLKPAIVIIGGVVATWLLSTLMLHLYNKVSRKPSNRSIQDDSQLISLDEAQPSPGCFSRFKSSLFCESGGAYSSLGESGHRPDFSYKALGLQAFKVGALAGGAFFTIALICCLIWALKSDDDTQYNLDLVNLLGKESISSNFWRDAAGIGTYLLYFLLTGPLSAGFALSLKKIDSKCVKVEEVKDDDLEGLLGEEDDNNAVLLVKFTSHSSSSDDENDAGSGDDDQAVVATSSRASF